MEKTSVGLTLYNEERGVHRVLKYLESNQSLVHELTIVSDACKDRTNDIVTDWMRNTSLKSPIRFVQRPIRHGRSNAIRLCVDHASYDLNVIMAGDILPTANSLANLTRYFVDQQVGAVSGHPILTNSYRTICDYLDHIMWTSHSRVGALQSKHGKFFHLSGEMFAIRKSYLRGFEDYVGIAEDAMIGSLIKQSGYRVLWAHDVTYLMQYPSNFRDWIKIRRRCCFGRVDLWKRCNIQNYPFYEVSHPEYILNIIYSTPKSPKGFLALSLGAFVETLLRIYYFQTRDKKREVLKELWEPARTTKW